jgi:hypothetical protein
MEMMTRRMRKRKGGRGKMRNVTTVTKHPKRERARRMSTMYSRAVSNASEL